MTVTVAHHKSKQEMMAVIDQRVESLFAGIAGKQVEIVNPRKSWTESTMNFSLTGKLGFIEVPLTGTVDVDDQNMTVTCEIPPMVKGFLGEAKILERVREEMSKLVA